MERRFRKEPKDLEDFIRRFYRARGLYSGFMTEDADGSNRQFIPIYDPDLAQKYGNSLVEKIHSLVNFADGQGHLFLFPLTASAHQYEFFKGIFRVLAPNARLVTLVTPNSHAVSNQPGHRYTEEQWRNLKTHLGRVLGKKPCSVLHVIDFVNQGITLRGISESFRAIQRSGEWDQRFPGLFSEVEAHLSRLPPAYFRDGSRSTQDLGWSKWVSGKRAGWVTPPRGRVPTDFERANAAFNRRHYFNLGIAYAKNYLKSRKPDEFLEGPTGRPFRKVRLIKDRKR